MPGNPSAPAYEPEVWNDKTTPEQRAAFIKDNRQLLVTILAVKDYAPSPADDLTRFRYDSKLSQNPDYQALQAVVGFLEEDERLGGDNERLAKKYGLKSDQIPELRAKMQGMGEAFGYQAYSNCYTYAMNDRDGLTSKHKNLEGDEPGTRGGTSSENTDVNWDKIRANNARDYEAYKKALMQGILDDGATAGGMDAEAKEGYYRVAVYAKKSPEGSPSSVPNFDMHFVRENRDGGWSHKPGSMPVTDKDSNGVPITDPKTADVGGYDFLGYVQVPEGGLDVGRRYEPVSKPGSIRLEEQRKTAPASAYGAFPDLAGMASQMPGPGASVPTEAAAIPEANTEKRRIIQHKQPALLP